MTDSTHDLDRLTGFMLGTMVGDAIGLPFEGLSRARIAARLRGRPLQHRLLFGRGLASDDTEHMVMTLRAWRASGGDVDRFARNLAWRLRGWMLALPPATGLATARACGRLLIGIPPSRSGVRSAGNGPAMRSGVLGAVCATDVELHAFVRAASRITHTDPRAEAGALAVALAVRCSVYATTEADRHASFTGALDRWLPDGAMRRAIDAARASVERGESLETFAASIECARGVSGYIMHTVPIVLHAWMSNPPDARSALTRMVRLGGDTDTTAALLGGVLGARDGVAGLPDDWLAGICDVPLSPAFMRREARAGDAPLVTWGTCLRPLRNVLFLTVVLAHAGRRALPPYARTPPT